MPTLLEEEKRRKQRKRREPTEEQMAGMIPGDIWDPREGRFTTAGELDRSIAQREGRERLLARSEQYERRQQGDRFLAERGVVQPRQVRPDGTVTIDRRPAWQTAIQPPAPGVEPALDVEPPAPGVEPPPEPPVPIVPEAPKVSFTTTDTAIDRMGKMPGIIPPDVDPMTARILTMRGDQKALEDLGITATRGQILGEPESVQRLKMHRFLTSPESLSKSERRQIEGDIERAKNILKKQRETLRQEQALKLEEGKLLDAKMQRERNRFELYRDMEKYQAELEDLPYKRAMADEKLRELKLKSDKTESEIAEQRQLEDLMLPTPRLSINGAVDKITSAATPADLDATYDEMSQVGVFVGIEPALINDMFITQAAYSYETPIQLAKSMDIVYDEDVQTVVGTKITPYKARALQEGVAEKLMPTDMLQRIMDDSDLKRGDSGYNQTVLEASVGILQAYKERGDEAWDEYQTRVMTQEAQAQRDAEVEVAGLAEMSAEHKETIAETILGDAAQRMAAVRGLGGEQRGLQVFGLMEKKVWSPDEIIEFAIAHLIKQHEGDPVAQSALSRILEHPELRSPATTRMLNDIVVNLKEGAKERQVKQQQEFDTAQEKQGAIRDKIEKESGGLATADFETPFSTEPIRFRKDGDKRTRWLQATGAERKRIEAEESRALRYLEVERDGNRAFQSLLDEQQKNIKNIVALTAMSEDEARLSMTESEFWRVTDNERISWSEMQKKGRSLREKWFTPEKLPVIWTPEESVEPVTPTEAPLPTGLRRPGAGWPGGTDERVTPENLGFGVFEMPDGQRIAARDETDIDTITAHGGNRLH